jgi:hypothetical protein
MLIIILMECVLVVDMFNIYCLVLGVRLSTYGVDISKAFEFFTRLVPSKLVPMSLQNVFCKLLVINHST